MSRKKRLTALTGFHPQGSFSFQQELHPPATDIEIESAESRLLARFPSGLRSLLLETNGVMRLMSIDGNEWFEDSWTVWPVEKIVEENEWYRERYANRGVARFVFFAGAGTDGIQFGVLSSREVHPVAPVYAWYPDETEDKLMADRLDQFLEGWCSGKITV